MEQKQDKRRNPGRRSGFDRRRIDPPRYTGIERRIDSKCRSGEDRRQDMASWSEMQPRCVK